MIESLFDGVAKELIIGAVALGYMLGGIPFGLVLTRLAGYGDIRKIGSGNIGATNVLRTGNKPLALATLILDSSKGGIAVYLASLAGDAPILPVLAGVSAVIGHNFPAFLNFKGGKGIATTLGTLLVMAWPVGVASCLTWVVVAALFRFSSLAGMASIVAAPVYAWFMYYVPNHELVAYGAAFLAVLALIRHRANIRRLLAGEEPKIGKKKS